MTGSNDRSPITAIDFTVLHDHGILVIEQLASKADHEGWDVYAEGAHAVPDSLYVGVRPSMEGAVCTSVRVVTSSLSVSRIATVSRRFSAVHLK